MKNSDLKSVIKRAVELAMPNLRGYYRVVRKARVVKTYASDGKYYADVQPLCNDHSADANEPVVPKAEIPVIWGGPKRGVVCPPATGTYCDLSYYDGDPNYPRISNFRWYGNQAPDVEIGGLIIQQTPGTSIKIDAEHNIIHITPSGITENAGGNWTISVGGNASIQAAGKASISAPSIVLAGNISTTGADGGTGATVMTANMTINGSMTITGPLNVNDSISATGSIVDQGGNTNHHTH